jgi:hypothetical protein
VVAACVLVGCRPLVTAGVDVLGTVVVVVVCVVVVSVDVVFVDVVCVEVGLGAVDELGGGVVVGVVLVELACVELTCVELPCVELGLGVGEGLGAGVAVADALVAVMVEASVVPVCPRSAEAGRAEAITRAAPTATVAPPAAALRIDPRGDVGGVLVMVPPAFGRQLSHCGGRGQAAG